MFVFVFVTNIPLPVPYASIIHNYAIIGTALRASAVNQTDEPGSKTTHALPFLLVLPGLVKITIPKKTYEINTCTP